MKKLSAKKVRKSGAKAKSTGGRKLKPFAKPKKRSVRSAIAEEGTKLAVRLGNIFATRPLDIVAAIKMDHDSLRKFLSILKDTDADMTERRRAYAQFSQLLKSHSRCEEQSLYDPVARLPGREMHVKIAEGLVEHQIADDIMRRREKTADALTWGAHANVLSENLEHHLREEEEDLLPLIRSATSSDQNQIMLDKYMALREGTQTRITNKNAGVLKTLDN